MRSYFRDVASAPRRAMLFPRSLLVLVVVLLGVPSLGHASALPSAATGSSAVPLHPQSTNHGGIYYFNLSASSSVSTGGVSSEVTAFAMPPYAGQGTASFEIATGVAVGGNFFVAGLEANNSFTGASVYAFAAELNDVTFVPVSFVQGPSPAVGSLVNLSVVLTGKQTWVADVNGAPLLNVTGLGGNATNLVLTALVSWNDTPWLPSGVYLPQAFRYLTTTGWTLPTMEYGLWIASVPSLSSPLNFSCQATNSSLAPGELTLGTAGSSPLHLQRNATRLWSSGLLKPAALTGTVTPTVVQAGSTANVTWRADSLTGKPLGGVRIAMWSSLGGNVTQMVTTNQGWANTTYRAPGVKTQELVYLNATILDNSYRGGSSASLTVSALVHVTVDLSATAVTAGKTPYVELVAWVRANGAPVGGALLFPSASVGGGAFVPLAPWSTDDSGHAYANYTPPAITGNVTVWVNASYSGYSASGNVTLVIRSGSHYSPPPAPSAPLWIYGTIGAVLALLIVVGMVLYSRRPRAKGPDLEQDRPSGPEASPPRTGKSP